jgi:putative glycosyltransferase (TIGR04372 family)
MTSPSEPPLAVSARRRENYDRYRASDRRSAMVDYLPTRLDFENVSRCTMCQVSEWPKGLFIGANPANRPLFEMWKRVLPIIDSRVLSAIYHYAGPRLTRTRFFQPLPDRYDDHAPVATSPVLAFTDEEVARGRRLLAEMGLGPDDWFVVFQNRDAGFHATAGKGDSGTHRLSALDGFLPIAEEITRRGGFAIRIGAAVSVPLPDTGNPRIVDYATRHRSDWGDIFLLGHCRFLLAAATGTIFVPGLFGLPVAQTGMLPLIPNPLGPRSLYMPQRLRDKDSGLELTFAALQARGAYRYDLPQKAFLRFPSEMDENRLVAVETTPADILDLTLDMFDRLDGITPDPESARLQALYKRRFLSHARDEALMPDIGARFALKYRHLIET